MTKSDLLNKYSNIAFLIAENHGFFQPRFSITHHLSMVICELSEAIGAARTDRHADKDKFMHEFVSAEDTPTPIEHFNNIFERYIKDTVEDEIADAYIRLLSLAGKLNIKFGEGGVPPSYVVSADKTITENIYNVVSALTADECSVEHRIRFAMNQIERMARFAGMSLVDHVKIKIRYNKTRPYLHDKSF